MSERYSRRAAIRAGALLSVSATLAGVVRPALAAAPALKTPDGSRTLTRLIERELKDGTLLGVTRSWVVRFTSEGQGLAIFGTQSAVVVDAPPRLAPIAAIERERSTIGMFPILLDSTGLIMAAGDSHSVADVREALSKAQSLLDVDTMQADEARSVKRTLNTLGRASSRMIETMPADLFYPREPRIELVRPVALPDGSTGEFKLLYTTRAEAGSGLLREAERRIVTRIGGQSRLSRERWTLG